jgi:hypothetical protein
MPQIRISMITPPPPTHTHRKNCVQEYCTDIVLVVIYVHHVYKLYDTFWREVCLCLTLSLTLFAVAQASFFFGAP